MTFEELLDFVATRMSMSHVYQPLVIKSLVDAGGAATVRQLAVALVSQDEASLIEAEGVLKKMPLRILKTHDVLYRDEDVVRLNVDKLNFVQRTKLREACDRRLHEFLVARGLSVWDYRMLDAPVSRSLRFAVLEASDRRCALCGATAKERPLDVDHIVPRSKGGRTEITNLQVLCSRCNRAKRDTSTQDYRETAFSESEADCLFCTLDPSTVVEEAGSVFAILDAYPVTTGHHLVIPRRHSPDFFTMSEAERREATELLRLLRNRLAADPEITGFNVGTNCGGAAGQTIFHAHIHLIPRRTGDVDDPRGGVRGVVPSQMTY